MSKNILALFFSFLFIMLVTAPTILLVVDDSIDASFAYDISEEEEEKSNESNKEFEMFVIDFDSESESFMLSDNKDYLEYAFKTYQKPHLNLISPPPEFIF